MLRLPRQHPVENPLENQTKTHAPDEILFDAKLFGTPSIRKKGYPRFKYVKNQTYLCQRAINKQAIAIAILHSLIDNPCNC